MAWIAAAADRRDLDQDAARGRVSAVAERPAAQRHPDRGRRAARRPHGLYGYARETTPNLERLRAAGILRVAPAVRTVCSETLCALPGLLASRYVHQFSDRMIMLSEVFKRHGYRTASILAGDHTHFYGLRELYGPVDSYFDGSSAGGQSISDDQVVVDHVNRLPLGTASRR
jgi:hypothetical protein